MAPRRNLAFFERRTTSCARSRKPPTPVMITRGCRQIRQAFLTVHPPGRSSDLPWHCRAGPPGTVVTPNLPWTVDAAILANAFGCPVNLLNDLAPTPAGCVCSRRKISPSSTPVARMRSAMPH